MGINWMSGMKVTISDGDGIVFAVHDFRTRKECAYLLESLQPFEMVPDWAIEEGSQVDEKSYIATEDLMADLHTAANSAGMIGE